METRKFKIHLLCLVMSLVGCSGGSAPVKQATEAPLVQEPVSVSADYDCETRTQPSVIAYMPDGSFKTLKLYPPTGDGSTVPCDAGSVVNSLVDCNGSKLGYFCTPSTFVCTYFTSDGTSTQELCQPQ
jgi:hypothetical protein